MNSYDPKKAAQVWARVQAQTPVIPDSALVMPMIAQERADATMYLHLSRRFQGKQSAALRRMAQQEQSHAAQLKGICALCAEKLPLLRTPPAPKESTAVLLRQCYEREKASSARYRLHAQHSEHGALFARLAAQEEEHCAILLELLGSLDKPTRRK